MAAPKKYQQISAETQKEAMTIAKSTQKQGQTKEQTKLIAQGIEKGIQLYKKQQKIKAREADKAHKKNRNEKRENQESIEAQEVGSGSHHSARLAWFLLGLSWLVFMGYWLAAH